MNDIGDWVKAGMIERAWGIDLNFIRQAMLASGQSKLAECITYWRTQLQEPVPAGRCFGSDMAAPTVLRLSSEWHERAADADSSDEDGPIKFPEPWFDGDTVGDYRIEPVQTAAKLSLFAKMLRICAGGYASSVARGSCFLYVVFVVGEDNSRPRAMFDLENNRGYRSLGQLKGPCNQKAPKELETAVKGWLRDQKDTRDPA